MKNGFRDLTGKQQNTVLEMEKVVIAFNTGLLTVPKAEMWFMQSLYLYAPRHENTFHWAYIQL